MLAQRWRDVDQPTKWTFFFTANLGVSTTRTQRWPDVVQPTFVICAILYVGPMLALRCKANKIKGTGFQFSSNTWWCWPNVGPTLCTQRQPSANDTTVCQSWPNVVLSGEYRIFTVWYWWPRHSTRNPAPGVIKFTILVDVLHSWSSLLYSQFDWFMPECREDEYFKEIVHFNYLTI